MSQKCCAVGGNHEAANHLWELYYGGWVAKNIFYMGHAGVIEFGGARIGGLSGIYNGKHYRLVCSSSLLITHPQGESNIVSCLLTEAIETACARHTTGECS